MRGGLKRGTEMIIFQERAFTRGILFIPSTIFFYLLSECACICVYVSGSWLSP